MKWIQSCLKNKLLIYLATIALCLVGVFCTLQSTISPFPVISGNSLSFDLSYPGANAQTVQNQIVNKITNKLESIDNLEYITTTTKAGQTSFNIALNSSTTADIFKAQLQVTQAISSANLPASVSAPDIKLSDGGTIGLITFILSSKSLSLFEMSNFIHAELIPKFNTLPGVSVYASDMNPIIKIGLEPSKLAQYHLNLNTVTEIINDNYQSRPLGSLQINESPYILNVANPINSLPDMGNLIIGSTQAPSTTHVKGLPIFLKDIATLSFEPKNIHDQPYSTFNDQPTATIKLLTTSNANPFSISSSSRAIVNKLKSSLPSDTDIKPLIDIASTMKASMNEVVFTIIIASILVLLVALIFLGRLKTTLIPIITIPVCLLGAITINYLFGYSINLITLLAMVIAVGLVVDDAIVVVENVTCYIERGKKKYQAIIEGASNIATTIIGITLTLIAVYTPILFTNTNTSSFLKPFALTLSAAVLISGIVALTLTPVMSESFISNQAPNAYQKKFEQALHRLIDHYHRVLLFILNHAKTAVALIFILLTIGGFFALKLPINVFPQDPNGNIMLTINGEPTDTVDSLKAKTALFEKYFQSPKIRFYAVDIDKDQNSGQLQSNVQLIYKLKYLSLLPALTDKINQFIKNQHITNTYATLGNSASSGNFDLGFFLYSNDSTAIVDQMATRITKHMENSPIFSMAQNDVNPMKKQLAFDIDTAKAIQYGISRQQITQLLSASFGGTTLDNYFSIAGLTVPVIVQLNNQDLTDPRSFEKLQITSATNGKTYPLNAFVSLKTIAQPTTISTFGNQATVKINANLAPGHSMGEAISYINQITKTQAPSAQIYYDGNARDYIEGNKENIWVAILGLSSVYFLLTILFRNLADPLIIMLTVPFSVIGGALALYLINGSINIYSTIGLITLIGLITKHGVLIVKFANRQLADGIAVKEAILAATHQRFRPILMTTLAMTFGALPLVFSSGLMFEARRNLGIVLIGGLIIGTVFSLLIVPLMYLFIKKAKDLVHLPRTKTLEN